VAELGKILQAYGMRISNKSTGMAVERRHMRRVKLLNRLILSSIVSGVSVIDFIVS
jgi:hypothetical protein